MNPLYFNLGLGFILLGALLFLWFTRMIKKPQTDQLKELRERDLAVLRKEEEVAQSG